MMCEDKLKGKTAHFRLPSASQKRACPNSLLTRTARRIPAHKRRTQGITDVPRPLDSAIMKRPLLLVTDLVNVKRGRNSKKRHSTVRNVQSHGNILRNNRMENTKKCCPDKKTHVSPARQRNQQRNGTSIEGETIIF